MNIKEIYERFERLHSYSFATINGDIPEIRTAHFLTYDQEGLYFMTMKVKPFYAQLTKTNKVAVCALVADAGASAHGEDGLSSFPPGYHIRLSGDVRELSLEEVAAKAKNDERFIPFLKDIERYPTMTTFVLHRFKGDVFDYDFEKEKRDHKIERQYFSYGGMEVIPPGFTIDQDKCIGCGLCQEVCTFSAIVPGEKYSIMGSRCDECGSCYAACPVDAIIPKHPMDEESRRECGRKIIEYTRSKK